MMVVEVVQTTKFTQEQVTEDHHGVVSVVHGMDFVAIQVCDSGRSLLNHRDVDGIGDGSNVGDFLSGENAFKRKASLC